VLKFLKELNEEGRTVVLITHDNSIAKQAKRIIKLADGCITYDGPSNGENAVVESEVQA